MGGEPAPHRRDLDHGRGPWADGGEARGVHPHGRALHGPQHADPAAADRDDGAVRPKRRRGVAAGGAFAPDYFATRWRSRGGAPSCFPTMIRPAPSAGPIAILVELLKRLWFPARRPPGWSGRAPTALP